ncbi:hypothetical protein VTK56DRAFT_670 [Thermocarpiscus australiensis]
MVGEEVPASRKFSFMSPPSRPGTMNTVLESNLGQTPGSLAPEWSQLGSQSGVDGEILVEVRRHDGNQDRSRRSLPRHKPAATRTPYTPFPGSDSSAFVSRHRREQLSRAFIL